MNEKKNNTILKNINSFFLGIVGTTACLRETKKSFIKLIKDVITIQAYSTLEQQLYFYFVAMITTNYLQFYINLLVDIHLVFVKEMRAIAII